MCLKKQNVVFYLPEGALFDATEHYCQLIKWAFEKFKCCELTVVQNLKNLQTDDILITIRLFDAFHSDVIPKKHIHWFQGVAPEEKVLLSNYTLRSRLSSLKTAFYERKVLRKADLCFFVSERMMKHYESKYFMKLEKKALIMPCYNLKLSPEMFLDMERYNKPTFVYAGSAAAWQCLDETLLVFKEIQQCISKAKLVILTKDCGSVNQLLEKYDVQNVTVGYVELTDLHRELSKYKYAFLLRKDCTVNNVATPTKMNSYLAAGLIPIYTSVIDSFERNITLAEYELKFKNLQPSEVASKIIHFEASVPNWNRLLSIYESIFENYYNDENYIEMIREKIKPFFNE